MIKSRTYMKTSHPYAYATFTDFEKGKGLVQIHSDWGIFHSFWGSMGNDNIEEFVLSIDNSYFISNLMFWPRFMGVKKSHEHLVDKFMIHCWPDLKEIIKREFKKEE